MPGVVKAYTHIQTLYSNGVLKMLLCVCLRTVSESLWKQTTRYLHHHLYLDICACAYTLYSQTHTHTNAPHTEYTTQKTNVLFRTRKQVQDFILKILIFKDWFLQSILFFEEMKETSS